mgnify:CR=1 FL=1
MLFRSEALARTNFPDGSIMLSALHSKGKLIKIATDKIEMQPRPAVSINLSELNQIIADQRGVSLEELSLKSSDKLKDKPKDDPSKTTSASVNYEPEEEVVSDTSVISTEEILSDEQKAKKYRSEADRLSKEAANFRRLAEELVPTAKKPRKQKSIV